MKEISWIDVIIPELIWIALLLKLYTHHEAIRLAKVFTSELNRVLPKNDGIIYGQISTFLGIEEKNKELIKDSLSNSDDLLKLQKGLNVLKVHYPNCPINFLFSTVPKDENLDSSLSLLKETLEELFDKQSKLSVFTRVIFILIAFESGNFKVFKGSELTNLSQIENYPHTDESRRVDASIRSSINLLIAQGLSESFNWPIEFWNRGLIIEDCIIHSYSKDE